LPQARAPWRSRLATYFSILHRGIEPPPLQHLGVRTCRIQEYYSGPKYKNYENVLYKVIFFKNIILMRREELKYDILRKNTALIWLFIQSSSLMMRLFSHE
jgi:hypothetical protein